MAFNQPEADFLEAAARAREELLMVMFLRMIEQQDEINLDVFDTSEAETNLETRLPKAENLIKGLVSRQKFAT